MADYFLASSFDRRPDLEGVRICKQCKSPLHTSHNARILTLLLSSCHKHRIERSGNHFPCKFLASYIKSVNHGL